jgi:uncharacterized protein (TIGR00255 family)
MFDLKIRIPSKYNEKEIELNKLIEKELCRGKIDANISIKSNDTDNNKRLLNSSLFKSYYKELKDLADELDDGDVTIFDSVLNLPDVFEAESCTTKINENEWKHIIQCVKDALIKVNEFRINEGGKLGEDLLLNLETIKKLCRKIDEVKDQRTESMAKRLEAKLAESLNGDYDKNRFEQEIIYFLEKLDITEEIDRFKHPYRLFQRGIQGRRQWTKTQLHLPGNWQGNKHHRLQGK